MFLCVTNRNLCQGNFLDRIRVLAQRADIEKIILREKDMTQEAYKALAKDCKEICCQFQKPLVINQNISVAQELQISEIQVSINLMRQYQKELETFYQVGVSIHSIEEAQEAQKLGADYLIAGHIFETDCKKGVPPRGLVFLKQVCDRVQIPVYGIGGISEKNIQQVLEAGAVGGCMMSGFMRP